MAFFTPIVVRLAVVKFIPWIIGFLAFGVPLLKNAISPPQAPVIPWWIWVVGIFVILIIFKRRR